MDKKYGVYICKVVASGMPSMSKALCGVPEEEGCP
jgi:hypothetical protein